MATSIFSIIEGLTVDKDDILEAEIFTEQYLSAQFPTYDFRQGTAIRDMTVRPNATLLALINKAIKYYFDDTDISSITDATDNDVVDKRLSNFFVTRKSGDKSVIRARLYFSFPTVTPIATIIPSSASFSVDNETLFYPQGSISVNPDPGASLRDPLKYYFLYDGAMEMHYVDIDLAAQSPTSDADLSEGDLLYFTIFSPYFLQGSIQYLVSSAVETESNTQMVERSYSAISTRNLINTPSIEASIGDQFNYAGEVYPVGLGNTDLYRDFITIPQTVDGQEVMRKYHRGGHVDVYVDTPLVTQRLQFSLDDDNSFSVSGPVLGITRSPESQSGREEDTVLPGEDFMYSTVNTSRYVEGVPVTDELDNGLSTTQVTTLTVPLGVPGETLTVDIQTYSGLGSIHSAINGVDQKVVCADYLVRAFEPVFINMVIDVRGGASTSAAKAAVEKYIKSIPAGGQLYVANVISVIQNAGVSNFIMPIQVEAVTKYRYREFDSADAGITDEKTESIVDTYNIRSNQMFNVGTIEFKEVTL